MPEYVIEDQGGIGLVNIEEGIYEATFKGVKERTITVDKEKRRILEWRFSIETDNGEVVITGITSNKISVGRLPSKAYRWFCALVGRELKSGEKINTDELVGTKVLVEVKNKKLRDGTPVSRVVDVKKLPKKEVKTTKNKSGKDV
ncbi:MAG: hypothetical protein QXS19_07620 [Candidatus Methanomethylicia archaeon]